MTNEVKQTSLSDELFSKDKIKDWPIRWSSTKWYDDKGNYVGYIEFKNGDLNGTKRFSEETLEELFKAMDLFTKNL